MPRDRTGTFEPQLIGKHERRFTGFDDKVIALYARGLTVREIQAFLKESYAVDVSPDLISTVTDAVVEEVTAWQTRPLGAVSRRVLRRPPGEDPRRSHGGSKAVYLALGVLPDGSRDILGIWIEQTEGAKFWMKVFTDLKTRGCQCRSPQRGRQWVESCFQLAKSRLLPQTHDARLQRASAERRPPAPLPCLSTHR